MINTGRNDWTITPELKPDIYTMYSETEKYWLHAPTTIFTTKWSCLPPVSGIYIPELFTD
jgi:hypothetical protein